MLVQKKTKILFLFWLIVSKKLQKNQKFNWDQICFTIKNENKNEISMIKKHCMLLEISKYKEVLLKYRKWGIMLKKIQKYSDLERGYFLFLIPLGSLLSIL